MATSTMVLCLPRGLGERLVEGGKKLSSYVVLLGKVLLLYRVIYPMLASLGVWSMGQEVMKC